MALLQQRMYAFLITCFLVSSVAFGDPLVTLVDKRQCVYENGKEVAVSLVVGSGSSLAGFSGELQYDPAKFCQPRIVSQDGRVAAVGMPLDEGRLDTSGAQATDGVASFRFAVYSLQTSSGVTALATSAVAELRLRVTGVGVPGSGASATLSVSNFQAARTVSEPWQTFDNPDTIISVDVALNDPTRATHWMLYE